MPAVLKSRLATAFLIFLLAPLTETRAADAPPRKGLAAPSPEGKVVSLHPPRALLRGEIFQAIQDELARLGISGGGKLWPGDLIIQSSVPVLKADVGLKVKRIGFDPYRRVVVFELCASHEPQYLPFEVTTHRDPQSLGLNSDLATHPLGAGGCGARTESLSMLQATHIKPPVLAKPGTPATLIMLGQNVRITTTVVPLQPGSMGQSILVRELTSARVMTAQVVDKDLLQTSF
jgi:hypothetical protein